jgi:hypothetical protein
LADIEKAKRLFKKAGLAFPRIPAELAARLRERGEWIFSTRKDNDIAVQLAGLYRRTQCEGLRDPGAFGPWRELVCDSVLPGLQVVAMFLHLGWAGVYGSR